MMNTKSLSSAIAAAALVSTIGLAYAQNTTQPDSSSTSPTLQQTTPGTQSPSNMNNAPSSMSNTPTDQSTSNNSTETMAERDARADRN